MTFIIFSNLYLQHESYSIISNNYNNYNNFCAQAIRPSFVQTDIKVPELNMNITNVAKTRRTRSTNCTKIERNDISSVCKTITTMSRARKRKGKLQSFVSKSTVTKNTSFTNRKNVKRHRRKSKIKFACNLSCEKVYFR